MPARLPTLMVTPALQQERQTWLTRRAERALIRCAHTIRDDKEK